MKSKIIVRARAELQCQAFVNVWRCFFFVSCFMMANLETLIIIFRFYFEAFIIWNKDRRYRGEGLQWTIFVIFWFFCASSCVFGSRDEEKIQREKKKTKQ